MANFRIIRASVPLTQPLVGSRVHATYPPGRLVRAAHQETKTFIISGIIIDEANMTRFLTPKDTVKLIGSYSRTFSIDGKFTAEMDAAFVDYRISWEALIERSFESMDQIDKINTFRTLKRRLYAVALPHRRFVDRFIKEVEVIVGNTV